MVLMSAKEMIKEEPYAMQQHNVMNMEENTVMEPEHGQQEAAMEQMLHAQCAKFVEALEVQTKEI